MSQQIHPAAFYVKNCSEHGHFSGWVCLDLVLILITIFLESPYQLVPGNQVDGYEADVANRYEEESQGLFATPYGKPPVKKHFS